MRQPFQFYDIQFKLSNSGTVQTLNFKKHVSGFDLWRCLLLAFCLDHFFEIASPVSAAAATAIPPTRAMFDELPSLCKIWSMKPALFAFLRDPILRCRRSVYEC